MGRGRTGLHFLRARRTFSARPCSELGAFSSKSASLYQPVGIRQAGHVSVGPPPEQPGPPTGGDPGSTRASGTERERGVTADTRGAGPRSPSTLAVPPALSRRAARANLHFDQNGFAQTFTSPNRAKIGLRTTSLRKGVDWGGPCPSLPHSGRNHLPCPDH